MSEATLSVRMRGLNDVILTRDATGRTVADYTITPEQLHELGTQLVKGAALYMAKQGTTPMTRPTPKPAGAGASPSRSSVAAQAAKKRPR